MIEQSNCILYTFDELIELLSTTDKTVVSIDKWYLDTKTNRYYEEPAYDFSYNPLTGEETIELLEATDSHADIYSVVLAD